MPKKTEFPRFRAHTRQRKEGVQTYYFWDGRGRGCHDVPLGTDREAALERYRQCELGIIPPPLAKKESKPKPIKRPTRLLKVRSFDGKRRKIDPAGWEGLPPWAPRMYLSAEARARACRRAFTITIAQFAAAIERADGKCELTGIPFDSTMIGPKIKSPWAPSIDRIDATRGYEADNIRLVCLIVNVALSNWGDTHLHTMAEALLRNAFPQSRKNTL